MKSTQLKYFLLAAMSVALFIGKAPAASEITNTQTPASASPAQRDGSHDFDFLIGDWKAHVRRLPERLKGSNVWVEYNGISNHKKLLDSNANFEEFDVLLLIKSFASRHRRCGSTILNRISGAFI